MALSGLSLRCCTLIEAPMVFRDTSNPLGFSGIAIDYLLRLQSVLKFTCSSFSLSPLSFTDFIFAMQNCTAPDGTIRPECPCDIGTAGFAMNPERFGRVDFLPFFLNDDFRTITHVDNVVRKGNGAFFLTAFTPGLWIAVAGLILAVAVGKMVDWRFGSSGKEKTMEIEPQNKQGWIAKVPMAMESTAFRLFGQTPDRIDGDSRSFQQRMLNLTIFILGFFIILVYESAMIASLVQEKISGEFRSPADFRNCRIPPNEVCITAGGAAEAFWNQAIATSPCHQESSARVRLLPNFSTLLEKTASKECKYSFGTGSVVRAATQGRYCERVTTVGRPFLEGGCGFVLPYGSPLTNRMTNATLELRARGELRTLMEYLDREDQCPEAEGTEISFGRLKGFFIFAFVVVGLQIVGMAVASLVQWRTWRRGKRERNVQ